MAIERTVADQPSNRSSLTYGFLQTRRMKPGKASERSTSNAVAQYVVMTFTSSDVKNIRIIRVSKSPNDEANGVAMLSNELVN
jgi:hypothetical protein